MRHHAHLLRQLHHSHGSNRLEALDQYTAKTTLSCLSGATCNGAPSAFLPTTPQTLGRFDNTGIMVPNTHCYVARVSCPANSTAPQPGCRMFGCVGELLIQTSFGTKNSSAQIAADLEATKPFYSQITEVTWWEPFFLRFACAFPPSRAYPHASPPL